MLGPASGKSDQTPIWMVSGTVPKIIISWSWGLSNYRLSHKQADLTNPLESIVTAQTDRQNAENSFFSRIDNSYAQKFAIEICICLFWTFGWIHRKRFTVKKKLKNQKVIKNYVCCESVSLFFLIPKNPSVPHFKWYSTNSVKVYKAVGIFCNFPLDAS
jgi:hypothetical protein